MNKRSFKKFPAYIKYIPKIPQIIYLIKNWPSYLLNWLGITNKGTTYYFRNNYKIKTIEGVDACTLNGVFIIGHYKKAIENIGHFDKPTIINAGANIGVFTIYTKMKIPDAKIFCYEPVPKNFNTLLENIKINNLKNVIPYCFGVCGKAERRRLYTEDSVSHSMFLNNYQKKEEQYININCTTIEKILQDNKIDTCDVLKIDTEGAEYEILPHDPS